MKIFLEDSPLISLGLELLWPCGREVEIFRFPLFLTNFCLTMRALPSPFFIKTLAICFASDSWEDSRFSNSSKDGCWTHPCINVTYEMYSRFNPQIIILLIRASEIASSGFNKKISEQRLLILRKYSEMERLPCVVLASSFSKIWSLASSFLLKSLSRVRQISWAELHRMMWSNKPWEIDHFNTNSAFAFNYFHLLNASTFPCLSVGEVVLFR